MSVLNVHEAPPAPGISNLRSPAGPLPVTFADLVSAELALARTMYPAIADEFEAIGIIREEFDEFWAIVRRRPEHRDPRLLLRELMQIAAMCQRAAADLGLVQRFCGQPLPFEDLVTDALQRERARRVVPELRTSHAAATILRHSLNRLEDGLELELHKDIRWLRTLIELAARCRMAADDLRLLERADRAAELERSRIAAPEAGAR